MTQDGMPYGIGSDQWPGLAKLMEEMGELQQVLGKIMACEGPSAIYWDSSSLVPALLDELADVRASLSFFILRNNLDSRTIALRVEDKFQKFQYWHQAHLAESQLQKAEAKEKERFWEKLYDDNGGRR